MTKAEAGMKKKERAALRAENPYKTVGHVLAEQIQKATGLELSLIHIS